MAPAVPIERIDARAFRIPTPSAEQDGTYRWRSTTLVAVHAHGGGLRGFGYSYGSLAMVALIHAELVPCVIGLDALSVEGAWRAMVREVRNVGRPGVASTAISAVDAALWDLKAKALNLPLATLLGRVHDAVPVYGSGGFTNLSPTALTAELGCFADAGIGRVKLKVGAAPHEDLDRVRAARRTVGEHVQLMVDANGAYTRKQALEKAADFAELGVTWFEEPVSSDDLEGLRLLRDRGPAGMSVAAGEYGFDAPYFRRMLEAGAVDVLQADATRCLGITGFLTAARLCEAFHVPLSAHTAPSLHVHPGCAAGPLIHVEYFIDHACIERELFDGFQEPRRGLLSPDLSRPGLGVELRDSDAERYAFGSRADAA